MKFNPSPTTCFGWLRLIVAAILVGHIVYTAAAHGIYFINAQYSTAITGVYILVDKFIGGIQGHYTADSKSDNDLEDK